MTAPTGEPGRVPPYVALVRIGAVIGMATAIAAGLFLLIGGWWWASLISFVLAAPPFLVMWLVERMAGPVEPPSAP